MIRRGETSTEATTRHTHQHASKLFACDGTMVGVATTHAKLPGACVHAPVALTVIATLATTIMMAVKYTASSDNANLLEAWRVDDAPRPHSLLAYQFGRQSHASSDVAMMSTGHGGGLAGTAAATDSDHTETKIASPQPHTFPTDSSVCTALVKKWAGHKFLVVEQIDEQMTNAMHALRQILSFARLTNRTLVEPYAGTHLGHSCSSFVHTPPFCTIQASATGYLFIGSAGQSA